VTADRVPPEERLLCAVYPDETTPERLAAIFTPGQGPVLDDLRERIDAALSSLPYRERGILQMRYGLGDGHPYTLAEAGYVFELTRERIRQIQVRALEKLRNGAGDLRDFLRNIAAR